MLDVGLLWNIIVSSVYTYVLFSLPCYFYKAFQREVRLSIEVALPRILLFLRIYSSPSIANDDVMFHNNLIHQFN